MQKKNTHDVHIQLLRLLGGSNVNNVSTSLLCLQEDKYPLTRTPTGLCVIINNENFRDPKAKRSGTEKDAGRC